MIRDVSVDVTVMVMHLCFCDGFGDSRADHTSIDHFCDDDSIGVADKGPTPFPLIPQDRRVLEAEVHLDFLKRRQNQEMNLMMMEC